MPDYSKFVALAGRLIAKRGRAVTLLKMSTGAADPNKPWKGKGYPDVEAQISDILAVFLDPKGTEIKSVVKDENLLKRVTDVALIAPHTQDLSSMTALEDGKVFRIEWVHVLKPGDTVCLYVFGLTR